MNSVWIKASITWCSIPVVLVAGSGMHNISKETITNREFIWLKRSESSTAPLESNFIVYFIMVSDKNVRSGLGYLSQTDRAYKYKLGVDPPESLVRPGK